MNKRELEEELKKTSSGRKFLEEAEPEKQTDNLIEFAKEQCEIFPEDSYMGKYLRETLKILQAEHCEDAISREDVIKAVDRHAFDTDDGLCLDEDISIILEELPPVKPVHKKQELYEDVVSRQAVDHLCFEFLKANTDDNIEFYEHFRDLPPVKPTRKRGKWIDIMVGDMSAQACDQCNTFYPLAYTGGGHKYCPNCGSFMMGSEEE